MKKITTIIILIATAFAANAQNELVNNGSTLKINSGAALFVNGNITNGAGGSISNDGTVQLSGNYNNNGNAGSGAGTWSFTGTGTQTIAGTASQFVLGNFTVNNAAGINISIPVLVNTTTTFTNGIVNAVSATAPLRFASGATVSGTPSNTSHVNGYVDKLGTGIFTYPVGDGTRYQKVDLNLTANAGGMAVKYFGTDASTAPFTTGGSDPVPLVSYNTNEYWDITPSTTASGTVTIFWDGYKDGFSNSAADRRVAHKVGGNWVNEGTIGTGTAAAGSVTSNAISTWSPFAMGSVVSVLPVKWLSVTGNVSGSSNATINWIVQEQNVAQYDIQKSTDGRSFLKVGTLASKGNGQHNYSFTDAAALTGIGYYRIRQIDVDDRSSLSAVVKLGGTNEKAVSVYPVPARTTVVVTVPQTLVTTNATLFDNTGKQIRTILLTNTADTIDVSDLPSGIYVLRFTNGSTSKLVKE